MPPIGASARGAFAGLGAGDGAHDDGGVAVDPELGGEGAAGGLRVVADHEAPLRGRGEQDAVDDVDHAVGGVEVRPDDRGVVREEAARADAEAQVVSGQRRRGAGLDRLVGEHATRDDVVLEDARQLGLVLRLEEGLDRLVAELRERLVGRRQDGDRARTL